MVVMTVALKDRLGCDVLDLRSGGWGASRFYKRSLPVRILVALPTMGLLSARKPRALRSLQVGKLS